jgi:outer membrane lipoprotein-sorting protein
MFPWSRGARGTIGSEQAASCGDFGFTGVKEERVRWGMLVFALISTEIMADPLTEAEVRFHALNTYQATMHSLAADGEQQVIRYFYRQPGWIRMEFVQPHHGVVLIYDPGTRRVHVWPFGLKHIPVLTLAPDSSLISRHGHRVDHSDAGALLANLLALRARGSMSSLGEAQVAGQAATGLDIVGDAGVDVAGVHRYRVWLAHESLFPLRVESFAAEKGLIETVDMEGVQIDVPFAEGFFTP